MEQAREPIVGGAVEKGVIGATKGVGLVLQEVGKELGRQLLPPELRSADPEPQIIYMLPESQQEANHAEAMKKPKRRVKNTSRRIASPRKKMAA